jgi:hypothetical protein
MHDDEDKDTNTDEVQNTVQANKKTKKIIPVGARFSAPIQTGPGAHPASFTMGTGSFFQG